MRVFYRVSLDDMQGILDSPELEAIEGTVAARLGLPILPPRYVSDALNDVCHVDWDAETLKKLLAQWRDLLIDVILADQSINRQPDGEFPPGEEPGDGDRLKTIAVLGMTRGFALRYLSKLYILEHQGAGALRAYLKRRRIPFAQAEAVVMKTLLAQAKQQRTP